MRKYSPLWVAYKLVKTFLRTGYVFSKIGLPKINAEEAEWIIWAPFYQVRFLLGGDQFIRTMAVYDHLKNSGKIVSLYTKKDIGKFHQRKVVFFLSEDFNVYRFADYTDILNHLIQNLEKQGNRVFPSSWEVGFWENKALMHQRFIELGIRTPDSVVLTVANAGLVNNIEAPSYPLLVKENHSCSSLGVHALASPLDLTRLLSQADFKKRNHAVVLQKRLNIHRDLRVILVGNQIVWHYWRINLSKEWRPTATGFGNQVDFGNFPERWREWIIEAFLKLSLTTGAFDIAWENDDLNTEPYILEVSPVYQPNPRPKQLDYLQRYGWWKKSLTLRDNYHIAYINLEFTIQEHLVKELVRKWG